WTVLDAAAACALLGVKRETLYAYAARGLVRSEPGPRGRARRYVLEDLERLRARRDARSGHGPVAGAALRWGEPVLETRVGTIEPRGPVYRGALAVDLAAAGASFEAVAELLWKGALPGAPPAWDHEPPRVDLDELARLVPRRSRPVDGLALGIASIALRDDARFGAHDEAELARARTLLLELAAMLGLARGASRVRAARKADGVAARALVALDGPKGDAPRAAVTRALVLLADHELNASSFAVRVAASTGADLYACVGAGVSALTGPRHGGAIERVEAYMQGVQEPGDVASVVGASMRRGEDVPGFGHALYPDGDPRAGPLLEAATSLAPSAPRVRAIVAVAQAIARRGGPPPTVDVGLAALVAALDLPAGSGAALFAIGRAAGWVAHALEQRAAGFLLRPRARYVGQPAG
ncbi:MAG TPA: citrate/2-methylcitrate synthase, partial [Byssovorax sp.]